MHLVRALIFAGGTGQRMNSRSKPKQFIEIHGKPILIYTLEHFEYHEEIHDSIYNGLVALRNRANPDDIILIHDGVRPLITDELITSNIKSVKKYGNSITVEPTRESVIISKDGSLALDAPPAHQMYVSKAPQSFYYKDIIEVYDKASEDGIKSIDSAHLLSIYDMPMQMVRSSKNNIKITEPADYYLFRALCKAVENQQIFGI
jgi:2-C-methyl-D-erythritol 4-phosphate cytidylyltransferase